MLIFLFFMLLEPLVLSVLASNGIFTGFEDGGVRLERMRRAACNEGDCKNGGICWPGAVTANTPPCLCPEAYVGTYCTLRINFCATTPPRCQNGRTCTNTDASPWFSCSCVPGFTGTSCEINIDDCASNPCLNGQCTDLVNNYRCSCYRGWEGSDCNINHNDCPAGACLNCGRCLDGNGTYTCDCENTGFKYDRCQTNIDDCASRPCLNGLCSDLVKDYSCSCFTGWEGRNCSVDTDYCLPGPCQNGGVCSDGNATFSCDCSRIDFTGDTCSSKIDDCASNPCQHGSRCIDGVRNYTCDCSATDFNGPNCQSRIDDCSPDPCKNNASCTDGLRDYSCSCFSGYSGKNCSDDIADCAPVKCPFNGSCLERSKQALYGNSTLPVPFNGTFSYALAAGFVCICPRGFYGDTCEINPNDCLIPGTNQSVCVHASNCTDGLASFTCHCLSGYAGPTCSVDINECELFGQPCQNGAVCKDLVADYACTNCPAGFGGKNCSIKLTGCDSNPCNNNATCQPILVHELPTPVHSYRCTCKLSWSGQQCNETTIASFTGSTSFTALMRSTTAISSGDWTFQLSFRTSLTQFDLIRLSSHWGVIRIGAHNSSLMLLFFNDSSSVIGQVAWPISDSLASADWMTLSVSLTNGRATLTRSVSGVRQPQTQLVDGLSDTFKRGQMSVDVGGERGSAIDSGFRGCVRDLRLVTNDSTFVVMETTVESGNVTWGVCSRSVQCGSPSPCEAKTSSMCFDLWNDFVCHCAAGFGGRDCSVELPSFSFGVGGKVSSASFTSVPGVSSVYGGDSWTIELRLVTLSRGAFLMLLGNQSDSATTPRLLATIDLTGRLSAQLLHSDGSQITALTSSDLVATGSFVSVKISVSVYRRELSLTVSSAVRSASMSSASPLSQLSGQLIIGGFSGAPAAPAPSLADSSGSRSKRSAPALPPSVKASLPIDFTAFRGIIAAPKINGFMTLILGPVSSDVADRLPRALAASDSLTVAIGAVNEDVCAIWKPCQNDAVCSNIFYNSFFCDCKVGWRSARCSVKDHCVPESEDCPTDNYCINLEPSGYKCLSKTSFLAWKSAVIALAAFIFGALLMLFVFFLLLNRHRKGKLSLGYFERQSQTVDTTESRRAERVLGKLQNRLSSGGGHAYVVADRRPTESAVDAYEMSAYEVANDADPALAYETADKGCESAPTVPVRAESAIGVSAYDEIPDLPANQKQQKPKPKQRQAQCNAMPKGSFGKQPEHLTADVMERGETPPELQEPQTVTGPSVSQSSVGAPLPVDGAIGIWPSEGEQPYDVCSNDV